MITTIDFLKSWSMEDSEIKSTDDIIKWINELNKTTYVNIKECSINDSTFWFYDDYNGEILNRKRSFFYIKGLRLFENNKFIGEQPIIFQPEIGYLGIICKKIDGILYFLMQAKIEPGNINCVQISPTIQATKSNFTRAHGGKLPSYFEYFEKSKKYNVIYDQIQSEQAARFYKKRNRNMILEIEEDIEVLPNFCWMTLGQIKKLMKIDNLVNMDTRTVLSGLPINSVVINENDEAEKLFKNKAFYRSMISADYTNSLPKAFGFINDYKMFKEITTVEIPLNQLIDWVIDDKGITCIKQNNFMVRYYDIVISGREVKEWTQPLFKAIGIATFGLIIRNNQGVLEFLVKIKPEIGSFDKIEIGPSIQWEPSHYIYEDNVVDEIFRKYMEEKTNVKHDVLLSEEGGRFFHEQNRNVIVYLENFEELDLPDGYLWLSFSTLNMMIQFNNVLNIQLRNLLSLLDI